jgi:hypothetical protein
MLSRVRGYNSTICVLSIDVSVLDLPGAIVTDRNAASGWASFLPVSEGLESIDRDRLFARSWKHPDDMYDEMSHKSVKVFRGLGSRSRGCTICYGCLRCQPGGANGISGVRNRIAGALPW